MNNYPSQYIYLFIQILATDDNGPLFEYVHVIKTCTCRSYRTATCLANFSKTLQP